MRREFVARAKPGDVDPDIEATRCRVVDRLKEDHEEELARPKRYDPHGPLIRRWRMVAWFEERNGRPRQKAENNSTKNSEENKSSESLTPPPTPPATLPTPPSPDTSASTKFSSFSEKKKKKRRKRKYNEQLELRMQHLLSLTERMLYIARQLDREIPAPRKRKRPREGEDEEREGHAAKKKRE